MQLIERENYLSLLDDIINNVEEGEGHSVFISGESGIGKTSLLRAFTKKTRKHYNVYEGICDALFTPRPLAPLYDIAWQIRHDLMHDAIDMDDRAGLFAAFFQELKKQEDTSILIFEDIHWADEATLDFIKFLARRISQLNCMFILTYRDNEIRDNHPLINVLGQLPPDSFSRIELSPLSEEAVHILAKQKGYDGDKLFNLSGGNPFYVNEILASYHDGVPATIRDGILSAYNRTAEKTRQVWDLLSVIPGRFEIRYLEKFDPCYLEAIDNCLVYQILIQQEGQIYFKHELFRRAIENGLSPLRRISLNKTILDLFLPAFEENHEIERIIHHAKNANEYDLVVKYAPIAARQAAAVGAHLQAAKLLLTAIEYYQGTDSDTLIELYEAYSFECYVTNKISESIVFTEKALKEIERGHDPERTANGLRVLSHLWWLHGNRNMALTYAQEAIQTVAALASSAVKAMVYSNMSQLMMLCDDPVQSLQWGHKAIVVAEEVHDQQSLSHALNNVGTVHMNMPATKQKGLEQLRRSLDIALKNCFGEHAARAYINIAASAVKLKDFALVKTTLDTALHYAEEKGLELWIPIMNLLRSRMYLDTAHWKEAKELADQLIRNACQGVIHATMISAVADLRTGQGDPLPMLLKAKKLAFEMKEKQIVLPILTALLEYEWLTGSSVLKNDDVEYISNSIDTSVYYFDHIELAYWMMKARSEHIKVENVHEAFDVTSVVKARKAATYWHKAGSYYMHALTLFDASDDDKKKALLLMQEIGADAVFEKLKQEMRSSGIKGIPRGLRKTTRSNTALLTGREMEVLLLLKDGLQNKEIAGKLFISAKTVDHHISSILFKLDVNSRVKAVGEAVRLEILK
jgi:DNA-binding CsgD family transcriptional regulator